MRKAIPTLLVILLLQSPSTLLARDYSYDYGEFGSPLSEVFETEETQKELVCQQRFGKTDSVLGEVDTDAKDLCKRGAAMARRMAERYAKRKGHLIGCFDAYHQGLHYSYEFHSSPTQEMILEARQRYTDGIKAAADHGISVANSQGTADAESIIINRFAAVVDQPNAQVDETFVYNKPIVPKELFSNAYINHKSSASNITTFDYGPVYQQGWINSNDNRNNHLAARYYYLFSVNSNNINKMPDRVCRNDMFTKHPLYDVSIWTWFESKREYNFQKYGWKESSGAWERFSKKSGPMAQDLEHRFYQTIDIQKYKKDRKEVIIGYDTQIDPNTGQEVQVPIKEIQIIDTPISKRGPKYYQAAYEYGFRQLYEDYYARVTFNNGFREGFKEGQIVGELVGQIVGEDVAREVADEMAYNEAYVTTASEAYLGQHYLNYSNKWEQIWDYFLNNAVIELIDFKTDGQVLDGIFKAGEKLRAVFSAQNIGLAGEDIRIALKGHDLTAFTPGSIYIEGSSSINNIESELLAELNSDIKPGQATWVTMQIGRRPEYIKNGIEHYGTQLNQDITEKIVIKEDAMISKIEPVISEIRGDGQIIVTVINPSNHITSHTIEVIGEAKIKNLDGVTEQKIDTKKILEIPADNAEKFVTLNFSGFDPMDLISHGQVEIKIQIKMANKVLHEETRIKQLNRSKDNSYARYLLDLINSPKKANPGKEIDVETRLETLKGYIYKWTKQDAGDSEIDSIKDNAVDYGNPVAVSRTILGQIRDTYIEAKLQGKVSIAAMSKYESLGAFLDTINPCNRGATMFCGKQRKRFKAVLAEFAPNSVEVEKAKKD